MKPTRLMIVFCACLVACALWPADAAAQGGRGGGNGGGNGRGGGGGNGGGSGGAHPGPGPGPSVQHGGGYYRPYYGYGGYYRPYYPYYGFYGGFGLGFGFGLYSGFYSPYYAGWYPYYGSYYGYAQYPYPPGPYYYSGNWASARIEVKPRDAGVYLDGYLVGMVDQFDGTFQRLDLPTGEHEIEVYMKGYRPYVQRTLFRPGEGYHFKAILEPLPAGAPDEPPPQPPANRPDPYNPGSQNPGYQYPGYQNPGYQNPGYQNPGYQNEPRDPRDPYVRQPPPPPQPGEPGRTNPMVERPGDRRGPEPGGFGTLNVRVQPGDAVVVIDGERWDSPEGGSRLVVQLAPGSHRIEVRKDGFKPYSSTVQVHPGETQSLNVSLPAGQN